MYQTALVCSCNPTLEDETRVVCSQEQVRLKIDRVTNKNPTITTLSLSQPTYFLNFVISNTFPNPATVLSTFIVITGNLS